MNSDSQLTTSSATSAALTDADRYCILGDRARPILKLEDWLRLAPPAKGRAHWKDGRSAKELARRWVGGELPEEVAELLDSSTAFSGFVPQVAFPERKTALDTRRGNTRNHDLLVIGTVKGERVVLDIEGKADERFGPTVAQRVASATKERERNPRSGALERVKSLCGSVLGAPPEEVGDVRYQLVHAIAAALNAAREFGATKVAWVAHEFRSASTDPKQREANARDLDAFVERLGGASAQAGGMLIGPIRLSVGIGNGVDVYVGKASVDV